MVNGVTCEQALSMNTMKGVNAYSKQLSDEEIRKKVHRRFSGGFWDSMGKLQLEFLVWSGLKPNHRLLDIGCGCLRGGVHYIKYLEEGNYSGLDINPSLIEAGKVEIEEARLGEKNPKLIVDDNFAFEKFNTKFDFMVSVSLFTHLPFNIIVRCLSNARESLAPGGVYYSSFFQAPEPAHLEPIEQGSRIVSKYDADPFHYSTDELLYMAQLAGLQLNVIGDWQHPRNQKMAAFSLPK